jgi:hypothetical protein
MNTKRGTARRLTLLGAAACLAAGAGCAKSPTVVNVLVATDETVPPLVLLRSSIALPADPETIRTNSIVSLYEIDGGLTGPFVFPMLFPVAVPSGWSGDVVITVDGLDGQDGKTVTATGMTSATATREQTTDAALTLTGVAPSGNGDAGVLTDASAGGDAAGSDGAAAGDAGTPD